MKNIFMVLMCISLASCMHSSQYVVSDNYRNRWIHSYTKTKDIDDELKNQKELLDHYEEKGYLYGREAIDLRSKTRAKIHILEKFKKENIF